jgi:CubicO group peptidase (beta-lactamase class C family)
MRRHPAIVSIWCLTLAAIFLPVSVRADSVGNDPRVASALRLVAAWIEAQSAYDTIPGVSAAIAHDQELVWSSGFGHADKERRAPAAADTIYSICSISKLFTGTGIMQLRDEGKVRLDAPISTYLPWFNLKQTDPGSGPVTLNGILTHTAGLPREADFPYWTRPNHQFPSREEVIAHLAKQEMLYPADRFSQYSNLGLTLAGEIIAAVSGQPYAEYIRQRILVPLRLNDTTSDIPESHKGGRLATGYAARTREGVRQPLPFYQVRGLAPAAGFASTAGDLVRFASWQFRLLERGGREVLDANTLREMHRVHWMDPETESLRGLAFAINRRNGKTFVGHGGNCPGFRTQLEISTADKIAVAVMMNTEAVDPGAYGRVIYDIIAPAVAQALKSPGQAAPTDVALTKYVGRYTAPLGSERQVLIMDGNLAILSLPTLNPLRSLMKLKKIGEHGFRRLRDDGRLGEPVDFEIESDGRVTRFRHENNFSYRLP